MRFMRFWLVVEVGVSARVQFKMRDGTYAQTDDAVVVARVWASTARQALSKAQRFPHCRGRCFDWLVAYPLEKG